MNIVTQLVSFSNYEKLIKMFNFFNFLKVKYLSDNEFSRGFH